MFGGDLYGGINLFLGMCLHECGHAVALMASDIKCKIRLLLPLGAIALPANETELKRSDELPWNAVAWIMQVGPLTNVLLMLLGMAINTYYPHPFFTSMAYMNGMLAIFNLIPVWKLDASQLWGLVMSSTADKDDPKITSVMTIAAMMVLGLILVTSVELNIWMILGHVLLQLKTIVVIIIMVAGIWHAQRSDDPKLALSKQAMPWKWRVVHIVLYLSQVFLVTQLS